MVRGRRALVTLTPYLYLMPLLVVYGGFIILSTVRTFVLSLYDIPGVNINIRTTFVGLGNFQRMFADPLFWDSLKHNLFWMGFALVVPIGAGLGLAVVLAQKSVRGRTALRTLWFLPQVLPSVVVGFIWMWVYNPNYGPINRLLESAGLGVLARPWLGDYALALPSILVMYSWAYYGFAMVIFLAGIQSIDDDLYDSAKVDGATSWQQFRHVTLPGLRQSFTVIILITMINSFKVFDLVRVVTNGGPGSSTYVLSYLLYNKVFYADDVGYGAAVAVVNATAIILISAVYLSYRRRVEAAW